MKKSEHAAKRLCALVAGFPKWYRFLSSNSRGNENKSEFDELLALIEQNKVKQNLNKQHESLSSMSSSSNSSYVRVLGNGADGTSKSVMLSVHERYLHIFNCGEGISRILMQMGYIKRIWQLRNLFITRCDWSQCVSGLLGLLFTSSTFVGSQREQLQLHAPFNLEALQERANFLLNLSTLKLTLYDYLDSSNCEFVDYPIKSKTIQLIRDSTPIQPYDNNHISYCYLITQSAASSSSSLSSSSSHNQQPDANAKPFRILLIDLPSLAFVSSFVSKLEKLENEINSIDLIVHYSPVELMLTSQYAHLISKIISLNAKSGQRSVHMLLNEHSSNEIPPKQIYAHKLLLNQLDDQIFACPTDGSPGAFGGQRLLTELQAKIEHHISKYELIDGRTSMKYELESSKSNVDVDKRSTQKKTTSLVDQLRTNLTELDWSLTTTTTKAFLDKKLPFWMKAESLTEKTSFFEKNLKDSTIDNYQKKAYPIVTFLGTSSSAPTNIRNVR
jgi:hypothetical protein